VCERIERRHLQGANYSIVVVAEGASPKEGTITVQSGEVDQFGHVRLGGISNVIQDEIGRRTGFETRVTILGHVLRGGTPTAYDRVLATRFGIAAIDAVHDGAFGTMVALQGDRIERVPIGDAVNLEPDLIGKYVERLLQERGQLPAKPSPVIDKEYLQKRGLI